MDAWVGSASWDEKEDDMVIVDKERTRACEAEYCNSD